VRAGKSAHLDDCPSQLFRCRSSDAPDHGEGLRLKLRYTLGLEEVHDNYSTHGHVCVCVAALLTHNIDHCPVLCELCRGAWRCPVAALKKSRLLACGIQNPRRRCLTNCTQPQVNSDATVSWSSDMTATLVSLLHTLTRRPPATQVQGRGVQRSPESVRVRNLFHLHRHLSVLALAFRRRLSAALADSAGERCRGCHPGSLIHRA
jgi:hypothetical protein